MRNLDPIFQRYRGGGQHARIRYVDAAAPNVTTIRAEFLRQAILRVSAMAARGEAEEVNAAANELERYLYWISENFLPQTRDALILRLRDLRLIAQRARRDLDCSTTTVERRA